jgi:hypothetical protein
MPSNGTAPDRGGQLVVAHDIPGRLRLRMPPGTRIEPLRATLGALPGVVGSAWSPRTRSLLVDYRPGDIGSDAILEAAATEVGADVSGAAPATRGEPPENLAVAVRETFSDLNRRVTRATGGGLDLGILVPLALTVWAGIEMFRGRVAPLAWSTALWYAHGLFRDYGVPPDR